MVGTEIATRTIAADLAGKIIPFEYCLAPFFIAQTNPKQLFLLASAILEIRCILTFKVFRTP